MEEGNKSSEWSPIVETTPVRYPCDGTIDFQRDGAAGVVAMVWILLFFFLKDPGGCEWYQGFREAQGG